MASMLACNVVVASMLACNVVVASLMYQDFSSFFSAEMVSSASDLKAGTQQYLIPVKYNFSSFIVALREIPG
jgi:hypothetical protein